MRVLVHLRQVGILRHYGNVFAELGRSGHEVTVLTRSLRGSTEEPVAKALAGNAGVTIAQVELETTPLQEHLSLRLRWMCDVLRYEHPDFAGSWIRERAWDLAPKGIVRWARLLALGGWRTSRTAISAVLAFDRIFPPPASYESLLDAEQPDVVLVSPLVVGPSIQVELLRAATRRGIPTGILIPSWDNLTTKGLVAYRPDRVFVWNEMQRSELERLHGISADSVAVTGAPAFDHWFEQTRGEDRALFVRRMGLDPARPYVLYLASSIQMAPSEPDFFERWHGIVRAASDELVRDVQVLVRPHPHAAAAWGVREFDLHPAVAVWPLDPEAVSSPDYYSDYENALRHCAAVVGLNTSSMIEATIFGKAVCTWEDGELGARQRQTLHYRYFGTVAGTGLNIATSAAEHLEHLGRAVRLGIAGIPDERSDAFVEAFVRPRGRDRAAAGIMAAEIAELGAMSSRVAIPGVAARLMGRFAARGQFILGLPLNDRPLRAVLVRFAAGLVLLSARSFAARLAMRAHARQFGHRAKKVQKRGRKAVRRRATRLRRKVTHRAKHAARAVRRGSSDSRDA